MLKSFINLHRQFENCVALQSLSTIHSDTPINKDVCFLILDQRSMHFHLQVWQAGNLNIWGK